MPVFLPDIELSSATSAVRNNRRAATHGTRANNAFRSSLRLPSVSRACLGKRSVFIVLNQMGKME